MPPSSRASFAPTMPGDYPGLWLSSTRLTTNPLNMIACCSNSILLRCGPSIKLAISLAISLAEPNETLLVQACESLGSASDMASEIASLMDGPQRNKMLMLQQAIMLSGLVVNRVLDNHKPG